MADTQESKKTEEESCTDVQEEFMHGIEQMNEGKEVVPGARHIEYHGQVIYIKVSDKASATFGTIEQGATENAEDNTYEKSTEKIEPKNNSSEDFSGLRKRYRKECSKHEVNCVEHGYIKPLNLDIQDFAVNLRIREEKRRQAVDDSFHGELDRHMESLKDHGQTIKVEELLNMVQDNKKYRIFFVGGVAGIGKSVLAKRIAYDWSCNETYRNIKCCFYIACRKLNNFLQKSDNEIETEEVQKYFDDVPVKDDKSTLFLIDGLDELQKPDMIQAFTEKFSESKFLILGRPHSQHFVDTIKERYQKLEIVGLDGDQIQKYIHKFNILSATVTENQPSTEQKIKETIQKSTNISAMTTIPQFLTTLCCIAMLSTENISISNNACIYCWMLFLFMRQHFQDKDLDNQNLGWEIFSRYSEQLLAICKQAFMLYNSGSIIFKKTELECKDEKFIEGFLLGVKNSAGDITKYMFKHLTIMEFLASIHVYFAKNKSKLFEDLLKEERYELISFVCNFVRFSLTEKTSSYDDEEEISYQLIKRLGDEVIRYEDERNIVRRTLNKLKKSPLDGTIRKRDAQNSIRDILNKLPNDEVLLKVRFLADCFVASDKVSDTNFLVQLLKSISPSSYVNVRLNAFDQSNMLSILRLATGNKVAHSEIKNAFSRIGFGIDYLKEMEILDYAKWVDIDWVQLNDIKYFTLDQSMLIHRNVAFCGGVGFHNCNVPLFTTNANASTATTTTTTTYVVTRSKKMKLKKLGMVNMSIHKSELDSAANLIGFAEWVELIHVRVGAKEFEGIMENLIEMKQRRLKGMWLLQCPLVNAELKQKMEENGVIIDEVVPISILILYEPDSRDFVLQLKENLDDKNGYIMMDQQIKEFERRYNNVPYILVVFIQHRISEEVEREILFAQNKSIKILLVKLEADFHPSKVLDSVFDSNPCLDLKKKPNNAEITIELNQTILAIMDEKFIIISNAPDNQAEAIKIKQKFADEIGCPVFVNTKLRKYEPRVVVVLLTDEYEKSEQCMEIIDYPWFLTKTNIISVKLDNGFQPCDKLDEIVRERTCICWTDKTNFDTNFAKVKDEINAKFPKPR